MSRRCLQILLISLVFVTILALTMPGVIHGNSGDQATEPTTGLKEPTVIIEVGGVEYELVEGMVIKDGANKGISIWAHVDDTTYGAGSIETHVSANGKDLIIKKVSFYPGGEHPHTSNTTR